MSQNKSFFLEIVSLWYLSQEKKKKHKHNNWCVSYELSGSICLGPKTMYYIWQSKKRKRTSNLLTSYFVPTFYFFFFAVLGLELRASY
jgi:hypothetical protein